MACHPKGRDVDTYDERWNALSGLLAQERNTGSFMSLLLDQELVSRATERLDEHPRVLDFGSGTGVLAFAVARSGAQVDAYEPTPSQHELLRSAVSEVPSTPIRALSAEDEIGGGYDVVLCVNVLDHIADFEATIAHLASWTRIGGRLLLVIPHPLKDYGDWRRDPPGGDATSYRFYVLHDYLREGVCVKTRENRHGQVIARDVPSHHRTISSYFNALLRHGFDVREMVEPAPAAAVADTEPVLYSKSSRIPYFLLFDCRRQVPASHQ